MKNKPLTILFDANPLVNGKKTGIGYYTHGLIQALADTYPNDLQLVGHYFNFLGSKDGSELPKAPNITYKQSRLLPGKLISITRRFGFQPPLEIFFRQRGDVALFANFFCLPSIFRIPRVVAIHDLCYVDVPQYVAEKNRKFLTQFVPDSIKRSKKIITISDSTKRSIMKHYGVPEDRFIITPIPPTARPKHIETNLTKLGINKKFILFVSTLEPRKNVINLVKAYELLPQKLKENYQLVLAGGIGWYMEETMAYVNKLQSSGGQIVITGYVSDEERAGLYSNASLFAFASHYEGFGMPILEAMDYGLPTAVSDIPVFHEISGNNGSIYFNKDNPESIAAAISEVLSNPKKRQILSSNGSKIVKAYRWENVAKTVHAALLSIAADNPELID